MSKPAGKKRGVTEYTVLPKTMVSPNISARQHADQPAISRHGFHHRRHGRNVVADDAAAGDAPGDIGDAIDAAFLIEIQLAIGDHFLGAGFEEEVEGALHDGHDDAAGAGEEHGGGDLRDSAKIGHLPIDHVGQIGQEPAGFDQRGQIAVNDSRPGIKQNYRQKYRAGHDQRAPDTRLQPNDAERQSSAGSQRAMASPSSSRLKFS